jgi:hypothetical protein
MRLCFFLAVLVTLNACGNNRTIVKPPVTFTEADLIGTWESVSKLHASETLSIRANHTFIQYYRGCINKFLHLLVFAAFCGIPSLIAQISITSSQYASIDDANL